MQWSMNNGCIFAKTCAEKDLSDDLKYMLYQLYDTLWVTAKG